MNKILLFFILLFGANISFANDYEWKVLRVIDGDTVEVQVGFLPKELGNKLKIRIYGVDTPEKDFRAKCKLEDAKGSAATVFTKKFIEGSKDVKVDIREWDKYGGRVLGDIIVDGKSLREALIENGYAREYFGEQKQSWCK